MWGVVFAFASVWCPEPRPAATDDDEGPNRSTKETCASIKSSEMSFHFFRERRPAAFAGRIAESAKPPVRAGKLMCRAFFPDFTFTPSDHA